MKIIATYTFTSRNVVEIVENEGRFDLSFYINAINVVGDYDRWEFPTLAATLAVFIDVIFHDDDVYFSNACKAAGGK